MLYKKHRFWCFSFVTLFNLQGTRPVRLGGGTYSILPRQSAFVKHFFQLFRSFFGACLGFPPLSQTAQLLYQSSKSLSSAFFTSLKTFLLSRWLDRRVSDSLLTIPDLPFFVNTFFQGFSFSSNYLSPGACATLFFLFPHLPYARNRAQNASFFAPFMVHIGYLSYILLLLLRVSYL